MASILSGTNLRSALEAERQADYAARVAAAGRVVTYWKGDRAAYTGHTVTLHGGLFYEIELLEGHRKGAGLKCHG